LAEVTDRRVKDRRPVKLPVIAGRRIRVLDHGVHDDRPFLVEGSARKRSQGATLKETRGDFGSRDRLQRSAAQVSQHPAVVAEGVEGQSQPAPGFLEVWKLAHAQSLWPLGASGLTSGSALPQETLNYR